MPSKTLYLLTLSTLVAGAFAEFTGTFKYTYPPIQAIPPVDSAQVKQWLSEIDMTKVPKVPVVKCNGQTPNSSSDSACDWSNTGCTTGDITVCPKGEWGLTYDDGPTQYSPTLYDFLAKSNQKATLFYIGSQVHDYWKNALMGCGAGHQIGVHTWSHNPSTCLTNEQFVAEIKWTETIINEVCGVIPKYFRPPYGDVDDRIRGLLTQMGYKNVIWDLDTNDWDLPPGGKLTVDKVDASFAGWIANAPKDTTGHICLEHELYNSTVSEAIKWLPKLQSAFTVKTVADCLGDANPYRSGSPNVTVSASASISSASASASASTTPSAPSSIPAAAASGSTGNTTSTPTSTPASLASKSGVASGVVVAVVAVLVAALVL
ncbi:hypothetical protein BC938DRAFT_482917 [Jimgerdemannia flammicorona]|uniref:NodB homology domain-containing protein n=1 Tax=Jimgerdemannia flammicorona TaxID=994334 RepID=A0A433R0F7_9FUNG|nr:hypothetical protein BC938DRAFT_482917 [Jimgerdemannia flammicorona]